MAKVRTTVTIDEGVMKMVRIQAARSGKGDSEVIEAALREHLGLDVLDRLWSREGLPEDEAQALALEAQAFARGEPS
ncbi:MAG: hypothetical protein QG597_3498 [Actinomycetota bacterium]|nr:hypothetical protein [Actinomycetota bacterium]